MSRLAVSCVILAQVLLPACTQYSTYHGDAPAGGGILGAIASNFNLGQAVFDILRSRLQVSTDHATEKVAALDGRHDDFVNAVNGVLTSDSLNQLGPTLQTVLGFVDDGTLPGMAEDIAVILDRLANEPGLKTLRAIHTLGGTKSAVQVGDVLAFASTAVNYNEAAQFMGALAQLIQANSGGTAGSKAHLFQDLEALLSRLLKEASNPTTTQPAGIFSGVPDELLVDAPLFGAAPGALGAPAWTVRVDKYGNPAVAADASGNLYPPFVDTDGDGVADVGADGRPVDAQGNPVDIPPFGIPGAQGRDADGLALDPGGSGARLYRYFDAKTTLLSYFFQLGGEALRRGIDEQAFDVAALALGPRVTISNGVPADDFLGFDPQNPVTDLAWGGLEILKYDGLPKFLRAGGNLVEASPDLFDRVLVTLGKIIEKLRPIELAPSSVPPAQSRALTDQLMVLADQVFEVRQTPPSVGRVLFDVLHNLGQSARDLPHELALMARYRALTLDQNGVPVSPSQLVDWTQPATPAGSPQGENRSTLHQLLDLLHAADQCKTYLFFGKPISETVIELMAGQSVGTTTTLIGFLQSPIVRAAAMLFCSGIGGDLDSLNSLASSGALNGFLPIAKAFVDKGETRLLVDILNTLDASYASVVRPDESKIADLLDSGAFGPIFDLLDLLVAGQGGQAIVDPATGERAVDVLADAVAALLAHPAGGAADRSGSAHATLLHLVLDPLRRIEDNVNTASGGQALHTALAYALTDLVIERVTDGSGVEHLANPAVGPFVGHLLQCMARNLPQDKASRTTMLANSQSSAVAALASRHFATAFDVGGTLRNAANAGPIRDAATQLLTPDRVAQNDMFGSVLKLVVCGLETSVDTGALRDIASFAGDLLDPATSGVGDLLTGAGKIVSADQGKTILAILRNALNVAPPAAHLPAGARPAGVVIDVIQAIRGVGSVGGGAGGDPVATLASSLGDLAAFIRDHQSGLGRLFDIIKAR